MRKNYLATLLFSMLITLNYAQCIPAGITTDPSSPVNTQNTDYINDFFDWQTEHFQVNSSFINASQVLSPYSPNLNLNSNTLHLSNNLDNSPDGGWELIAWDFGIDEDGVFENPAAGNIHFILYNKYTSLLRIFVAGQDNSAYNSASISLYTSSSPLDPNLLAQPSLLQDPNHLTGLDSHYDQRLVSASNFLNGLVSNWFYADFFINYDPCVCLYESNINFVVKYISNSTIDITGNFIGSVTQVSNGIGSTTNGYNFKIQDLIDGGQKAYKQYETLNKFVIDQEKAAKIYQIPDQDLTPEQRKQKDSWNKLQEFMAGDEVLQTAFNFVPYLGSAFELVKFFVGKSKSTTPSAPKPMAINGTLELEGNIQTANDYIAPTYYTPGSYNSNQSNSQYPYYNEVLGVFNLIETPKLKYNYSYFVQLYGTELIDDNINHIRYTDRITQLDELEFSQNELKYTLNPVLGLSEDDYELLGALSFDVNNISTSTPYTMERKVYETDVYPLNCLFTTKFEIGGTKDAQFEFLNGNLVQNSVVETPVSEVGLGNLLATDYSYVQYLNASPFNNYSREMTVSLKLYLTIKLPDGSKTINVLTYPLETIPTSTFSKPSTSNSVQPLYVLDEPLVLPSGLGNIVIQANNIVIGQNANVSAAGTTSLTFQAMNQIDVLPDAEISPNVTLEIIPKQGCYTEPVNVMLSDIVVSNFCNSSAYKGIRSKSNYNNEVLLKDSIARIEFSVYPNPTNSNTWVSYNVLESSLVSIEITDLSGSLVEKSYEQFQPSGSHKIELQSVNLAKGIYMCTLTINGIPSTKPLIIQ